jgi:hypothetical protein
MTMKTLSKEKRILRHLLKGRKITQQMAIRKFQHYRLAVVIHRLRESGYFIKTTMKTEHGSTFAEYKMIKL